MRAEATWAFQRSRRALKAAPAIGRAELHREEVAQLAVEVGGFRLRPFEDADQHVAQRRQAFGDDAQGHRLAGPGLARRSSAKPPSWTSCSTRQAKFSMAAVTSRASPGSSGENGFHFSPHSDNSFLVFMHVSPSWEGGFLGRYAGGSPVAE